MALYVKICCVLVFVASSACSQFDCSRIEYDRCVKIADPLIKEARLIFPDNVDDIALVCRTWNEFVDCLKRYIDRCFTEQQRRQFNKAVENPVESVHQMCTQQSYQQEYLQYATCIKSTITERAHCGNQYGLLVDQVAQGQVTAKASLCCSHDRFKQCVLKETKRQCDRGAPNGPASRFSNQIINKALSFLQEQCFNYIPNSGDCVSITTDTVPYTDPLMISTSPSEIYPWSTVQEAAAPKEMPSAHARQPSSASWLPSSSVSTDYTPSSSMKPQTFTKSRAGSYGRSSWSDSTTNTQPDTNTPSNTPHTHQIYSSSTPSWSTVTTWHVATEANLNTPDLAPIDDVYSTRNDPKTQSVTQTWFPAAGNQLANEVDEPNQQGLTKPENGATKTTSKLISLTVIAILATFS